MKKTSLGLDALIHSHRSHKRAPVCLTCGAYCEEWHLVEGEPDSTPFARVLVRHHGQEELRTFDMGTVCWDGDDLGKMIRSAEWFDPKVETGGSALILTESK